MAEQRLSVMKKLQTKKIVVIAFVIGCVIPILLSIFSILVSFETGLRMAYVFFPFGSIDEIDDSIKIFMNGLAYASVAGFILFLSKVLGSIKH